MVNNRGEEIEWHEIFVSMLHAQFLYDLIRSVGCPIRLSPGKQFLATTGFKI
jgi:hypothetical protein